MKNKLFAVMFALAFAVLFNAGQASAQLPQGLKVDVPFAFTANNKSFPAGTYIVDSASDNRTVWNIKSTEPDAGRMFLLSKTIAGVENTGNVLLTFHRYGNEHFLSGFTTLSYQVELPMSNNEKDVRHSMGGSAKYQVVTTEAVAVR